MILRNISLCLVSLALAQTTWAEGPTFTQTAPLIQNALLKKDLAVLTRQVDLSGIVRAKIPKKLKLVSAPLARLVTEIVLKEYRASTYSIRQSYLNRLKISRIGEKDNIGYAVGTFMGSPCYISALRINGTWVIVGANSAFIDRELDNLLRLIVK
jgi:hypothetical protein